LNLDGDAISSAVPGYLRGDGTVIDRIAPSAMGLEIGVW
jgi:hypothetical protein